ncbi:MAG: hypothetical protein JWN05_2029 [Arthrobacter sp.]|nr:hypothetical protein [Arthrobacter sp.]
MFKKIAIAMTAGALSLTGCSFAPTTDGAPSPAGQASNPAADPASPAEETPHPEDETVPDEETPYPEDETVPDEAAPNEAGVAAPEEAASDAVAAEAAGSDPAPGAEAAAGETAGAGTAPAEAASGTTPPAAIAAPAKPAPSKPAPTKGDGTQAATTFGWGAVVAGDEFSNTGAPDSTKWSVFNGKGHHGKGIRSPQAWSVANGVATVKGNAEGTTGGMSAKFANQKYGRWESRMKTSDRDPKYHPVMILWPDNESSTCAEIDYAEGTADTKMMKFFLHYSCDRSDFQTTAAKPIDATQWHNYAVEWTPAGITGYIDGVKTFSDTNPAHQPTVSMHQTLQLDWFPDGSATKPSQMQVDWVRVYK